MQTTAFTDLGREELLSLKEKLLGRYQAFQARELSLDMTRGKPSPKQLDLSTGMLAGEISSQYLSPSGVD